ncbi:MAG TPA: GNAT family N-acetyltransferase [Planctomycetota bacterium]|nr:GNAT family N-acetyltransferase [Planctomycetota bacterium]
MNAAAIRLAEAEDFAAIAAITNHYIKTTAIHFNYVQVTAEELRSLWREHLDVYPWLVREVGGTVAAYAKAGVYRARRAYHWTTETGIYVAAEHCGRGIGRPLYERLLAVLRAQGFHSVIGGIALPNDASVRLHERLGFVHCGTMPRVGRKFDRWHDVGFWQLALQPDDHNPTELVPPALAFAATGRG